MGYILRKVSLENLTIIKHGEERETVEIRSNLFHELVRIDVSPVTNCNGNSSRFLLRKHSASIGRKGTSSKIIHFFFNP